MSNDRIRVNITSNQNSVEVTNTENKVIVTDKKQDTNVNVIQNETSVVTIVSKGPKGDRGEKGEQASLSGSVYITGSLEVSSSVTAQSFTGSLFGTASNALTASFITPTGTNAFVQGGNSFGATALLGTNDNQNLQLETSGSVRVHIGNNGNVGIGTTSPTSTLQVNGSITATNLTVTNGSVVATLSPRAGSTGLLLSSNDGSDTRIFTDSITTGINSSGSAPYASAYGSGSKAIGTASFSEGIGSLASGFAAHAAGLNTTASGQAAFSVGVETDADGMASFAAGSGSWARGTATVAMGIGTIASASGQTVVGHYNLGLGDFNNLFVVGGGSGITTNLRKNLFRVYGGSGASTVGVEINTSPTQNTSTIDGFNVWGKTIFHSGVTGSSIDFNAVGVDGKTIFDPELGTITTGSFTSNFYRIENALGGGYEDVLKASVRLDHRGINFSLSEQTASPGSTFLWTNSSNRLFYGSNPIILNGGNTIGGVMTLGTNDNQNLQLETNNTTRVFISSSGNVGIGTTSPTERLYVDGNLLVTGRITAEEFHTEFVSASIIYQSGSTQFGNSSDDTHIFTGSLRVNGSITGSLFGTASNALTSSFITPTGTNAFVQGGNSFGATALLGTNDNQNLQLETSGSVRVHIGNNGNVGIGTTSPISTLTVAGGDININTGYGIGGNNVGSYTPFIRYNTNAGIVSSSFGHTTAYMLSDAGGLFGTNDISFYAGAFTQPEIMRIVGSTGFVGIGESSPSAKLEIRGSGATSATTAFRVENSNASASLTILDDGTSAFNTSHLYVSSSGNVGIGLTSPLARLHISGANALRMQNTGFDTFEWFFSAGTGIGFRNVTDGTTPFFVGGTDDIGIGTTNTSARLHVSGASNSNLLRVGSPTNANILFVSGSGNVGIGTTTPTRTLYVSSSVWDNTSGAGVVIENSNTVGSGLTLKPSNSVVTNGSNGWAIYAGGPDAGVGDGNLGFWAHGTNQARLVIQRAGNVGIGTTTPQRRLHVDASGSANTDIPLLLTSVDANNRVGIRFASSSLSAGRQHSLFNRVSTPTAEWLLGTNAGETAQWNFIPRDDTNYAITLRTPFNGGTAQITTGLSQSLFSLGAGGTANQHLNISSSGNVGIGTTTPTQRLDVRGNTIIAGTTPLNPVGGTLEVYNNASNAVLVIHEDSGSAEGRLWFRTEGSDTIFRNLNTRFSIDAESKSDALTLSLGGRVGIGTSTSVPSSLLQVRGEGATSATTAFRVENSNASASLTILDDGTSAFNTNHLYVSSSGNVGIGTTTPAARLQIAGTPNDGISLDANNTSFNGINARLPGRIIVGASSTAYPKIMYNAIPSSSFSWSYAANDTAWAINMGGSNRMSFEYVAPGTAGTSFNSWNTIMTLVSGSNNVGIGTGTPVHNLVVDGNTGISINAGGTTFPNIHRDSTDGGMLLRSWNGSTSTFTNNVKITPTSNVGIGTTNPLSLLHISASSGNEFLRITSGSQNILNIRSGSAVFFAGTGVAPSSGFDLDIQGTGTANGGSVRILGNSTTWAFASVSSVNRGSTGNPDMFNVTMGGTSATLVQNPMKIQFDANQSSTGGGGYTVLRLNATHAPTAGTGSKLLQTWEFGGNAQSVIDISGSLGIGTGSTPNARLFVSGANADTLLRVGSPAQANILFVSGSGFIGVGTTTPGVALDVVGGSIRTSNTIFTSATQTNTIQLNTGTNLRFLSASVETARYDNNGWGFFNNAPAAKVHISGANADALFRVSSPSATSALFVSGSGNVGIGTTTPTTTLNVNGTTLLQGGQTTVRGSGATSATTALIVQNSTPTNLMTILDNGQFTYTTPTIILPASQSAYTISPVISASNVVGGQYYGVNITPTFFQTTGSQTETAFRVAATFTQSSAAATSGTNIIADFGASSVGSQLTVTDVTSGSIYMVNDVSGLPIIEANSGWDVNIYNFPNTVFRKSGNNIELGVQSNTGSVLTFYADTILNEGYGFTYRTTQVSGSTSGAVTSSLWNITFGSVSSSVYVNAVVTGYDTASRDTITGDVKATIRYRSGVASIVGYNQSFSNTDNSDVSFNVVAGGTSGSLRVFGTGSRTYQWGATITTQVI